MDLYITVETTSRELEAKTFLACKAAVEGFDVTIGLEDMVRRVASMRKKGIFFDKSTHPEYLQLFKALKPLGHFIVVNDEEGLVVHPQRYTSFNVSRELSEHLDIFFAWGEFQKTLLESPAPDLVEKTIVAGNPRMDLLHPKLRPFHQPLVDELKDEYGDFILINTNFGYANHASGEQKFLQSINEGAMGEDREYLLEHYQFSRSLFIEFQSMIGQLCERFPDKQFIIRPHPSESLVFWENFLKKFKNAKPVRKGNVHQWILASDLIIHNGCTTAIESFLLGRLALSYRPVLSKKMDLSLPNSVSHNCFDINDLFKGIENKDQYQSKIDGEMLNRYVHFSQDTLATEKIINELKLLTEHKSKRALPTSAIIRAYGILSHINRSIKKKKNELLGRKKHPSPDSKWKRISLTDFQKLVRRFYFYDNRFQDLIITDAYQDCFRISYPDKN